MLKLNADTVCSFVLRLLLVLLIREVWPGLKSCIGFGHAPVKPSAQLVCVEEILSSPIPDVIDCSASVQVHPDARL